MQSACNATFACDNEDQAPCKTEDLAKFLSESPKGMLMAILFCRYCRAANHKLAFSDKSMQSSSGFSDLYEGIVVKAAAVKLAR